MVICAKCRVAMQPVHVGRVVRWRGHWCRSGDEHECPTCGARIVAGLAHEGYDDRSQLGDFIEMQQSAYEA